ncbi:MAG: lipopolysaccharide kinase InaA family protein, partial [Acidobacteriota bacterium]
QGRQHGIGLRLGKFRGDVYRSDYAAINEIFLSGTAWKKGVPVALLAFVMAAPAGTGRLASYWRGYSASIKVQGARSLGDWLSSPLASDERRLVIEAAASAVQRAHGRGFEHGDLNLGNILVTRSEQGEFGGWLIDLSHSRMGGTLSLKKRLGNLMRLYRSAEKWLPAGTPEERLGRRRDIIRFLRCYTDGEPGAVRRYLQAAGRYRSSLFLHRLGWKAGRVGRARSLSRSTDPAGR